ncbi:AgrD family cyclic lactone autoinducer peptide [Clostridium sp. ZS2-4]|nr:cyclic lactone autoinducer peptide [Clostridium sp. ZS2-4]MCY6355221.1 cyclic lactone autoinducer peptide [Clostridium sp. ZS2-4]
MKSNIKFKSATHILGLCLLVLAGAISKSSCLFFLGEPTPPESLLK